MTRDDIIRMALEAQMPLIYSDVALERFAALVAAHEREACAKACDAKAIIEGAVIEGGTAQRCAAAIRARGET